MDCIGRLPSTIALCVLSVSLDIIICPVCSVLKMHSWSLFSRLLPSIVAILFQFAVGIPISILVRILVSVYKTYCFKKVVHNSIAEVIGREESCEGLGGTQSSGHGQGWPHMPSN